MYAWHLRQDQQQGRHDDHVHFCADIPIEAILDDSVDSSLDVPLPAPWDDVPATASGDDNNMEAVAAEPQQATEAVAVSSPSETSAEMEEEANKKGYGKAYAAFGGGREGLEACAASESLLSPHDAVRAFIQTAQAWHGRLCC